MKESPPMLDESAELVYQIDQDDLLIFFNAQRDAFAEDNDCADLVSRNICRTSIWQFIHDAETRHLHQILLKKVRTEAVMLDLEFRCDSPVLRRFMRMQICGKESGRVEYRCRIIRTEPREPVVIASAPVTGCGPLLRLCSWCKKMDVGRDSWMEIEDAVNFLGLFSLTEIPPITHTICADCFNALEDA
ncbi:hypothetical protein Q9Q94_12695 [Uliginosibacterium sp. 31-16]|uniref:hypothetical protein n=1 Tax=Uliginosibacterium sp. 31-16 TaxID=3068315 RepID=UPI00273F1316|nr:hypothetical protein [Uliginosibacterium sp. 31-16]MDP5240393.1 hypothetical protein [Uliginosibacterium sp. 31-16]